MEEWDALENRDEGRDDGGESEGRAEVWGEFTAKAEPKRAANAITILTGREIFMNGPAGQNCSTN